MGPELAIVGFALSVPGTILVFAKYGQHIEKLAKDYSNAPTLIKEAEILGKSLCQGQLMTDIDLAGKVYLDMTVTYERSKEGLDLHLTKLQALSIEVIGVLENCCNKKGEVRKTYFACWGRSKLATKLSEIGKWQKGFKSIIDLIETRSRQFSEDLLLSDDKIKVIHRANGNDFSPVEPGWRQVLMARADYKQETPREIDILVERMPRDHNQKEVDVEKVASKISARLNAEGRLGILCCLGYRLEPQPELIFEIPESMCNPRSLETVILETSALAGGGYKLEERFRLCQNIAQAVLSVFKSRMVHKSIRPETILLFEHRDHAFSGRHSLDRPILSEWRMLRGLNDVSSKEGSNDWKRDIYRHPERQGLEPESKYNIGHDIYSLGVTLLQISLWQPFVDDREELGISSSFQSAALELGLVADEHRALRKKYLHPANVKKTMIQLAKAGIPPLMGSSVADFVVACLNCLEGDMGDVDLFKNNDPAAALCLLSMVEEKIKLEVK